MATSSDIVPDRTREFRSESPAAQFWTRFIRDKASVAGLLIILLLALLAMFPDLFSSVDPNRISVRDRLSPPTSEFIMGTDHLGRDVWSRVAHGSRVSLFVAALGVSLACVLGTPLGVVSGYLGGKVDNIVMRLLDVLMAFPAILLALMLIASLGPGMISVIIVVGLVYAPRFARVARGAVLTVREITYVEAARALGGSTVRIMWRHILPNIIAPISVLITVSIGMIILVEATLSFLGLGLQPPHSSWGYMLATGKDFMELSPWPVVGPGVAIMVAVMGFNLLGDGLRDLTDPSLK